MKHVIIEDPHRLLRDISHVLAALEDVGFGQPSYGFFYGGDPRHFTPDGESTTPEEHARWKADCAAFVKGSQGPTPPSCAPNTDAFTYTDKQGKPHTSAPGTVIVTKSFYGLGTNLNTTEAEIFEDLMDLQQQLQRAAVSDHL